MQMYQFLTLLATITMTGALAAKKCTTFLTVISMLYVIMALVARYFGF